MPEDGYHGEDIIGIGKSLPKNLAINMYNVDEKERFDFFREYGLKYEMAKLKADLENFRVHFDVWYSETSLIPKWKN